MNDHDALLRALVENPDEDTPRLVYADWLDEHADTLPVPAAVRAHAQFIRDDIALSRLDEYDPLRLRWELIEKPEREAAGWVRDRLPVLQWGSFARGPLFRRGFPWAVAVPPGRVGSLSEVPFPLERVQLDRRGRDAVEVLRRAPWRERLRTIEFANLGGTSPTDVLSPFALERLERLAFLSDAINPAEARALVASPLFRRLTALTITRAPVGQAVAEAMVGEGAATGLRELHLTNSRVPADALVDLLGSHAANCLETLALGGDRIGAPQKFRAFERALALPPVRALDVGDERPGEAGIESLLASALPPRLCRLDLSRCWLSGDCIRALAGGGFGALRVLRLHSNPAGNDGAVALARAPHLAGLLVLNLGYSQVGDEGVEAILESPLADGLVLLDLTGSPASEEMKEVLKARMGDRVRV